MTLTSRPPGMLAGVLQVISVLDETDTPAAGTPPNVTLAPKANPVPLIVTAVPPVVGPVPGVTEAIVGITGGSQEAGPAVFYAIGGTGAATIFEGCSGLISIAWGGSGADWRSALHPAPVF